MTRNDPHHEHPCKTSPAEHSKEDEQPTSREQGSQPDSPTEQYGKPNKEDVVNMPTEVHEAWAKLAVFIPPNVLSPLEIKILQFTLTKNFLIAKRICAGNVDDFKREAVLGDIQFPTPTITERKEMQIEILRTLDPKQFASVDHFTKSAEKRLGMLEEVMLMEQEKNQETLESERERLYQLKKEYEIATRI